MIQKNRGIAQLEEHSAYIRKVFSSNLNTPTKFLKYKKNIMKILKRVNKFYDTKRFGCPQIRVHHKAGTKKRMPRYLLKCGCCEQKLAIYYDEIERDIDLGLEINGVNGAIADWREILLPLLDINPKDIEKIKRKKNKYKN